MSSRVNSCVFVPVCAYVHVLQVRDCVFSIIVCIHESCCTFKRVWSNLWVRHITHVEQPCHTYSYRTATSHTHTGVSRTLRMAGLAGLCPKTILQIVADCCSVLQCLAVSCSVLQMACLAGLFPQMMLQCVAVCCSVLQRVAVCCRWPGLSYRSFPQINTQWQGCFTENDPHT